MGAIDTNSAKTVDEYLNDIDYSDFDNYIPSDFSLEFINFIKLVNGAEGEEHKTPVIHYKMLDGIANKKQNIANMLFRGASKTSVFGEYLFLYLGVYGSIPKFGKVELALYVSDTVENGVKNLRKNLEYRWNNSEFLQHYIPEIKFTDIRWEFRNRDGNIFVVRAYGAKTGVRGVKEQGKRPVLAVLDDLINDEDARSATIIQSIEDVVYKAVTYALHPTRHKIIWNGTPFNAKDPLYKAIESGSWYSNVFPVCEKFPCKRKEFRGAWPDRFDYDFVRKQYNLALRSGKIDTFNQELMLRIMSDEDRLIEEKDIRWYKRSRITDNPRLFNFYITTDFATSEKKSADYSVISVWAYNSNGDWFWVDGVVAKQLMDKNIDDLFRLAQMWKPQEVGIEISGQQKGFISWIQDEMLRRNIYFTLAKDKGSNTFGIRPYTDKMSRFSVVLPWFKMGKMYFPEELRESKEIAEAMDELRLISKAGFKSKHDDFIDTISMLQNLNAWKPSQEAIPASSKDNGLWDFDLEEPDTNRLESYLV